MKTQTIETQENTNKVTVKMLMDSLKDFPEDAPVEISITQANKRYPVAYVIPSCNVHASDEQYASMRDGKTVRISAHLPWDANSMMITSVRKMK